jgi:hypothetical protein
VVVAALDAGRQFLDGLGLVAARPIVGFEDEFCHADNLYHSETVEQGQPAIRFVEGIYKEVPLVYFGKGQLEKISTCKKFILERFQAKLVYCRIQLISLSGRSTLNMSTRFFTNADENTLLRKFQGLVEGRV